MKNFFLLLSLSFLCVACCVTRKATPSETVRVETRVETVYVPDTVIVERPQIIERVATPDTSSVLENKYAKSEASFSNGILHHSLEAKPVKEQVPVQSKTVYRDSLVYVDRYIFETKEVVKPLTWWQKLRLHLGSSVLILFALALIYLCTKYIHKFLIH